MEEKNIAVSSFLLIKHIKDLERDDDRLILIGTICQRLFDVDDVGLSNFSEGELEEAFFQYRFNEATADVDGDMLQARRIERFNEHKLFKRTYQVAAPVDVNVFFDCFPFQIGKGTLQIELSSDTTNANQLRLRPNIYLSDVKTDNLCIQSPLLMKAGLKKDVKGFTEAIIDKMDLSKNFDFITPCPKIEFLYDRKKSYCPKYRITFYFVKSGMAKFVENALPLLLISAMNTVSVLENPQAENTDFIANAATFALTAVFILPNIIAAENRQTIYTVNNLYIILIFFGLTLSSLSESMMNSRRPSIAGMIMLWSSLIIPIVNAVRYGKEKRRILNESKIENFTELNGKKPPFKDGKISFEDRFHSPKEIIESHNKHGYKTDDTFEKITLISYE